jgi:hypothetical protein
MNSSQRRREHREFSHVIKLVAGPPMRYFAHDDKVLEARGWCKQHVTGHYRVVTYFDHAEFKFTKEGDAVHFALKWL